MNLTIVSVPLPFKGNQLTTTHQHNAIHSWTFLEPRPEIVLLGDEFGVAAAAEQYGVRHAPKIGVNELGDLSMRSIFNLADDESHTDWICYVDTDVILLDDFMPNFEHLVARFGKFVSCAGRLDANVLHPLDFSNLGWQQKAIASIYKLGRRGSDYCIYPKGLYHNMPDFSIGKGYWDGWRMGVPLENGIPLVNLERSCYAIHQKHGHRMGSSPGIKRNKKIAVGKIAWIKDATDYVERKDIMG